jgi:predicted nucleotidyltransferase
MAQTTRPETFARIEGIVPRIVERFHPRWILLFGSYASGMSTPESDVDMLVVVQEPPERQEAYRFSSDLQARFSLRLQLLFMGEREFEETRDVIGGIAYPASHSGKVLYGQNS